MATPWPEIAAKRSFAAGALFSLFSLLVIIQRLKYSNGYFTAGEMAGYSAAVLALSAGIWILLFRLLKDLLFSALLSGMISFLFFNGNRIFLLVESNLVAYEYFSTGFYSKILTFLLLTVLTAVLFLFTYRHFDRHRRLIVDFFILFLAVNVVIEMSMTFGGYPETPRKDVSMKVRSVRSGNCPNIYFIILDSYTSPGSLKKYWNYTDPALENFLSRNRIHASSHARTRFAGTSYCLSSYLNMAWEPGFRTETLRSFYLSLDHLRNNEATGFLRQQGYRIRNLSLFRLGEEKNVYEYFPEVNLWGHSFPYLVYRMARKLHPLPYELRVNFSLVREITALSARPANPAEPRFTYAHLMLPHSRYLLDSAGRICGERIGSDKELYLDQLKFARKMMVYLYSTIIRNDPGAVILIQGDHGYRFLPGPEERQAESFTPFNSLYLSGQPLSADTLACLDRPVNNFRIVLNRYFGTGMEMIRD